MENNRVIFELFFLRLLYRNSNITKYKKYQVK